MKHVRSLKSLLTSRRIGTAGVLVFVIFLSVFLVAKPAAACGITEPVDCVVQILLWFTDLILQLLGKMITLVISLLTPVMLYNNFTTAPVVVQGWALVRDTVNMFFVIILIVIAFGTIFGHKKFQWQTQVPRLLLFAVVINFSKTLAGIMIDFGQIVMLTFANALREIAAGNIIDLFGLNQVTQLSPTAGAFKPAGGQGLSNWELLFTNLAGIFLLVIVFVLLLLLVVVLMYRVVALWILIVVAPLAWFVGGAEIIGSNAYKDWWSKFKCLVAVGPIVTFFLWLALAVAGAGTGTEGFETVSSGNEANFLTSIFEFQHIISMIVGVALIMGGMQTAQDFCSAMSGTFLGKTLGKMAAVAPGAGAMVKGATLKGAGKGARLVGAGVRGVGRFAGRELGARAENVPGLRVLTAKGGADVWRKIGGAAGTGRFGRFVNRVASKRAEALEAKRPGEIAAAGEKFKGLSADTKLEQLQRFAANKPLTKGGQFEAQALFKDMLGDKDMQDKLRASGDLDKLWGAYGKDTEKSFKGDKKTSDQMAAFKKRHADITGSVGDIKTFEDAKNLSNKALLDPEIKKKLSAISATDKKGKKIIGTKEDGTKGELSALEAMKRGLGGTDAVKQAITTLGPSAYYSTLTPEELKRVNTKELQKHGSADTAAQFTGAMASQGDFNRVQELVTNILGNYQASTSDQERFNLNGMLDQMQGTLKIQVDTGDLQGVMKSQAEAMMQKIQLQRDAAAQMMGNWSNGAFQKNFGRMPTLASQDNPAEFVQKNFGQASLERLTDAGRQTGEQRVQTQEKKDSVQSQLNERLSGAGETLRSEIEKLGQDLAAARQKATATVQTRIAELQKEHDALNQEFTSKASRGANISELSGLKGKMDENERQQKTAEGSVDDDTEVKRVQAELDLKLAVDPASTEGVKALQEELASLDKELSKIDLAREAIDSLTSQRNA